MIFQECFAFESNASLLFLFLYFRCSDMRETIFGEAMAVACLDSMYVINYNFFSQFFFVVKMCLVSQKTVWEKKSFAFESENENPRETLKCLMAGYFLFFFMGRTGLNLGILFLG